MSDTNVEMNWKTGDVANDRHLARYQRCLYELIKELNTVEKNSEVWDILRKYNVKLLEGYRVNLDFPSDFDQTVLPPELK